MFRNIVEKSSMQNNDEVVYYSETERKESYIGRLVISRPVHPQENLNTDYDGDKEFEKVHPSTHAIDAYYKIKWKIENWKRMSNPSMTSFLSNYIAYAYYDCLSAGLPKYEMAILNFMCKQEGVNLNENVYPGKGNDWYTINDFLNDSNRESIFEMQRYIIPMLKQLPIN